MRELARRHALGTGSAAIWAVGAGSANGAEKPQVPVGLLKGKSCLVIGPDDPIKAAVRETLTAGSASVSLMPILPSDEKQWAEALVTGSTRPERLDVIVNLCNPERGGAHGRIDHAEFRRILDRNYTRTFLVLKYGTRALGASGGGTIINVTSNAAMTGAANSAARCAAAHGIALMTRSAALSGAAAFVRVNALLAGDVAASGATTLDAGQTSPEVVAAAVAFLAADASKYFTGLLMPVDNGGAAR